MRILKLFSLFLFVFGSALQLQADDTSLRNELKRLLAAVDEACGFKSGQTPSRTPACMEAQHRMQSYHAQHRLEIAELKKEQDVKTLKQMQSDYDENCLEDSATFEWEHKRKLIEQGRRSGLLKTR